MLAATAAAAAIALRYCVPGEVRGVPAPLLVVVPGGGVLAVVKAAMIASHAERVAAAVASATSFVCSLLAADTDIVGEPGLATLLAVSTSCACCSSVS
jgi:hypothetical protein